MELQYKAPKSALIAVWLLCRGKTFSSLVEALLFITIFNTCRPVILSHWTRSLVKCLMEPATGVEPATSRLQIACTANCATPAYKPRNWIRTSI